MRHLLLGDDCVAEVQNMRFRQHSPVKHPQNPFMVREHPWEAKYLGWTSFLRDECEPTFRMWYTAMTFRDRKGVIRYPQWNKPSWQSTLCYATSSDGIHWEKPNLGLVQYEDIKDTNILAIGRGDMDGPIVTYDDAESDPEKKYKLMWFGAEDFVPYKLEDGMVMGAGPNDGIFCATSPDGIQWKEVDNNPVLHTYSDGPCITMRVPETGRFRAYGRFGFGRKVAMTESDDFERWTQPQLVMDTDDADPFSTVFYAMSVCQYESHYIGLPCLFHMRTRDTRTLVDDNRLDIQLVYSKDGIRWHRSRGRKPFIPNGPEGTWDSGMVRTTARPVLMVDDQIYIYYDGFPWLHVGEQDMSQPHGQGLAILRRDGFMSLEADQVDGHFMTPAQKYRGGKLYINAHTSGGYVRAVPCDPLTLDPLEGASLSEPFAGDSTRAELTWPAGLPDSLKGQEIHVKFVCRNANVYSYWFED